MSLKYLETIKQGDPRQSLADYCGSDSPNRNDLVRNGLGKFTVKRWQNLKAGHDMAYVIWLDAGASVNLNGKPLASDPVTCTITLPDGTDLNSCQFEGFVEESGFYEIQIMQDRWPETMHQVIFEVQA